jgi:hypothetical protein
VARSYLQLEVLEDRLVLSTDMVLRWNTVALDAVKNDFALGHTPQNPGPTGSARALAITQAAVYDAVNAIDGTYSSYLTDVQAKAGTSMDAAVAQAAHDTLSSLFSDQKATFDQALASDLAAIPDGPAQQDGINLGAFTAGRMLADRKNDGVNVITQYQGGTAPGDWQPDPLHPTQTAWGDNAGNITTFALLSADQFHVPPPPALDSAAYAAAYQEVKDVGGDGITTPTQRTPEETEIAIFWGYDGTPGMGTPPRLYNQIAQTIAIQQGNTEVQNARMFALINIAMADAGIACWFGKFTYNFWRPVTAIRAGDTDGNAATAADANWTPLGAPNDNGGGTNFTPPFPAYASGHATFGAAVFQTLADFYGTNNISFTIGSDEFNGITKDQNGQVRPVLTRHFDSFSQAAEENGQSRIYLGIHWQFDKQQGIAQGDQIADYISQNFLKSTVSPTQRFLDNAYQSLLGRPIDATGLAAWSALMDQGGTAQQVVQGITHSAEFRTDEVEQMYQEFLHRTADPQGLSAFTNFLAQGGTLEQAQALVSGSPEYLQLHGGDNSGFLAALYQDVVHRAIDANGSATFTQLLANGTSRAQVADMVISSLECRQVVVGDLFQQFLHRPGDTAGMSTFVNALGQGAQEGDIAAAMVGSQEFQAHLQ